MLAVAKKIDVGSYLSVLGILFIISIGIVAAGRVNADENEDERRDERLFPVLSNAFHLLQEGRAIFRYDTFGNEDFWGGKLGLHKAIAGESLAGVGPGVSPATALTVGLKVDKHALPKRVLRSIQGGKVDLNDPAVTVDLLRFNAVVGVKGVFDRADKLSSIGITCALCHSDVDDSIAPGIGRRLDGWAARDLNVGAIIALAPDLSPFASMLSVSEDTVRSVLNTWGPGKFDAALFLDGNAFQSNGESAAVLIPPAFGLAGVNLHTSTGWGSISYWNAFVAVLTMQGKGNFYDPRLNDPNKFPVAAANGFGNVRSEVDLVTSKLGALQFYQLAIPTPKPPRGSYNRRAAKRGKHLFSGKAQCATCHVPPLYTEPGQNLHTAQEMGIDDFQAQRSPEGGYRTTPLKGLWSHTKGGFFHDGRFATLNDVINHYNDAFHLALTEKEKYYLVEFLKSL